MPKAGKDGRAKMMRRARGEGGRAKEGKSIKDFRREQKSKKDGKSSTAR